MKPVRVRLFLLQVFVSFFDFSFIHSFMFIRHTPHHYNKGGIIKKVEGSRWRGNLKETMGLIKNQVSSGLKISKSDMAIRTSKSSTSFYKNKSN